jgi:hypothetical protein
MATGIAAGLLTALVYYAFVRRATYNLLDPLLLVGIFIGFSATFLAVLCDTGVVPWDKFGLFSVVLLGYLLGGWLATSVFKLETFRKVLNDAVAQFRRSEIIAMLALVGLLTLLLAILAGQSAAGDARQEFDKQFRPLVTLQSGVFLFTLVFLVTRRLSFAQVVTALGVLVVLSVPFSGKSVLVPILYFYGLRVFASGHRPSLRSIVVMASLTMVGVAVMGIIAYHADGVMGVLVLIGSRFWASGDVYLLAYQSHALDAIRNYYHPTFLGYMLHPITALFGVRAYDRPLGGMLSSEVLGTDVLTGPNPQLPVVLDFFFPDSMAICFVIATIIGFLVLSIRSAVILWSRSRSRFLRLGGVVAAVYCPVAGFLDFSLVLIGLIGVAGVTVLGMGIDLLAARLPRTGAASSAPAIAETR